MRYQSVFCVYLITVDTRSYQQSQIDVYTSCQNATRLLLPTALLTTTLALTTIFSLPLTEHRGLKGTHRNLSTFSTVFTVVRELIGGNF